MTSIVLVYSHGPSISTPDAIGRNLCIGLRQAGHEVFPIAIREKSPKLPTGLDTTAAVLIGHPTYSVHEAFNFLCRNYSFKRIIVLSPFCPRDIRKYGYLGAMGGLVDSFAVITGAYWFDQIAEKGYLSEWISDMYHVDLAVDTNDFPNVKDGEYNEPNKRKFLTIGNYPYWKNVEFLDNVAAALPQYEFHRIGPPHRRFAHLIQHGKMPMNSTEALEIVRKCDFFITTGNLDPNPTTILESMALGLVPVCSEGSGYYKTRGLETFDTKNLNGTIETLEKLQSVPAHVLRESAEFNRAQISDHYSWGRFVRQIIEIMEIPTDQRSAIRVKKLSLHSKMATLVAFLRNKHFPFHL